MELLKSTRPILIFVCSLWIIKIYESLTSNSLGHFGILPRSFEGLAGIFFAPLIHGDFSHLLSNSVPLVILGVALLFFYPTIAEKTIVYIYLLTGGLVWIFAREAYHIGASGVVYGLAGFLFFSGIFRKDSKSIFITAAVAFLYGGMLHGIFPVEKGVSFESHLLGAIVGGAMAYRYRLSESELDGSARAKTPEFDFEQGYRNMEGKGFRYLYKEAGKKEA